MSHTDTLNDIADTVVSINTLADNINGQIATLRTQADAHAEAVHAAKQDGNKAPAFSSSDEYIRINDLVRKLQAAHQNIGNIGGNLVRFAP